ncbi:MAG TPA: hypothetical protein VM713_08305 [Steroidobacteraceae bacterium]|nr:hypothetical protein [Steroidobacteraceae bacterium]
MSGVGIVAALRAESRLLGPVRARRGSCAVLADGTLLVVSGMGLAAAGEGARRLVPAGARALVSFGMAGGLDPRLVAGSIVLPSEVVSSDGAHFATTGHWREHVGAAVGARHPVCFGALLSCRQAIGSVADKAEVFRNTAAAAVDMESAAVAEVATSERLPFLAVRAIVDTASDSLPPALVEVIGPGGAARIGRVLALLARRPADLGLLFQLLRRYRAARRALATVARCGALALHAGDPRSEGVGT